MQCGTRTRTTLLLYYFTLLYDRNLPTPPPPPQSPHQYKLFLLIVARIITWQFEALLSTSTRQRHPVGAPAHSLPYSCHPFLPSFYFNYSIIPYHPSTSPSPRSPHSWTLPTWYTSLPSPMTRRPMLPRSRVWKT